MHTQLFSFIELFEDALWIYMGAPAIIVLGVYLSIKSRFFQIRNFPVVVKSFFSCLISKEKNERGIHPLKAFFACVGGCVGVGNVVGICTAIQVGGPGALFWIWMTAIVGSVVKYSEVYLGLKYRVENAEGGYSGGPMYYLQRVAGKKWIPILVCLLLGIYGVEVYQFSVITETVSGNFSLNRGLVASLLLVMIIYAGNGGVRRVGNISSMIIPVFVVLYMVMGAWVLFQNIEVIPALVKQVFFSAFTRTSATGGFLGSTIMMTISQGVRRGCYTADVGVGYASVIHSESASQSPEKQASLVIFDVFLDTFLVCTMSVFLILVSGAWNRPMEAGLLVQTSLSKYFPLVDFFMPLFLLFLGYSTITAYYCVGLKCLEFVTKKYGRALFTIYAGSALMLSAFVDTSHAQSIMAISGGGLLLINCWGIYRMRGEISFSLEEPKMTLSPLPTDV